RGADAVHRLVPRLAVADHEGDVEVGRGLLEGDAMRALGSQRLPLVSRRVVAELAAGRRALPPVAPHDVPVWLVLPLMLLTQKRVVEDAERDLQQLAIPRERCP